MLSVKEFLIFLFLFLVVFGFALFIFNGRFIYAQLKYSFLGPPPIYSEMSALKVAIQNSKQYPQQIAIPSLGVNAPIVLPESIDENTLQKSLEKGVMHWPESSLLGEKGTMIILGHSSAYPWYRGDYGSVFSLLDKLEEGNEIIVFSNDKQYVYRVAGKEIRIPEELIIETQKEESTLYLISCWPINTNWKRIAVKAILLTN